MMNIKYIGKGPDEGKIHVKNTDGTTGCGARYDDNPEDWVDTYAAVTCEKNGCA